MEWRKLISQTVGQESLGVIEDFVYEENIVSKSAIDQFYDESRLVLINTPNHISKSDWIGASNMVILVSNTENYFRTILGDILSFCPITRKKAADNSISFGSVLWHPNHLIERGAFEHISFSDTKKIVEITKKYTGLELNNTDMLPILEEFAKICELRHGVVHSGRNLAGKNALILDLASSDKVVKIGLGYGQLQNVALICTTLVVSYNQKLFEYLCHNWAVKWRALPNWDINFENQLFKRIWQIFHSRIDLADGNISEIGGWQKCRNLVKQEYNLT